MPSESFDWVPCTNVVAAAIASDSFWPFMLPEVSMTSATAERAPASWRTSAAVWPFSTTCRSGVRLGSGVSAVTFTVGHALVSTCLIVRLGADAAAGAATARAATETSSSVRRLRRRITDRPAEDGRRCALARLVLEEVRRQVDAVRGHLVQEVRLQAGAAQGTEQPVAGVLVRRAVLDGLGDEDVLQRDHVRLHPQHLGDVRDAAGAVDQARDLDDEVERARDLLADGPERKLDARGQHQRLGAGKGVTRVVGVNRGERAVVAGVHGLEHVHGLGAAALAHDDPVGAHTQGVADEVADRDLALALDVGRPRLERDHVLLLQLELGRVLHRDDALVGGDGRREHVQGGGLTGAGTARDQDVQLAAYARLQELAG